MTDQSIYIERRRVALELVKLFLDKTSNEERWVHLKNADTFIELYNRFYKETK